MMRLPSISRSRSTAARLGSLVRRPAALVDRGVEVVSEAAGTVEQASPAHRGRGHKQTVVVVATVAVGAAAAGTAAYLWWRHRRDQRYARLFQPEPQRPDPVPAGPPDDQRDAPGPRSEIAVDEQPAEAVAQTAEAEPAEPEGTAEPAGPPAAQPVATHAPFGDLDVLASPELDGRPLRPRAAAARRTIAPPPPELPQATSSRIPSWRIPLPLGRTITPHSR